MIEYRAYLLDGEGHIFSRIDLECEDDEHALTQARQYVDGCDVEVWQRARRVGKLTNHPGKSNAT